MQKNKTKSVEQSKVQPLRIGFLHPDLGIGGAEQLVVNLALGLQNKGHSVIIFTPFHSKQKNQSFKETVDGTLEVQVHGNLFPRHIFGQCIAMCAYIRMLLAAIWIIFYAGHFDLIIVDQVSIVVPLFRFFNRKVLFYCHFPDKLLCVDRKSILKRFYRFFLDFIEEFSLYFSNLIVVNSLFTKEIFAKNFKLLNRLKIFPDVLYPSVDFTKFQTVSPSEGSVEALDKGLTPAQYFFSLNRYERKKNIGLAIQAFAEFKRLRGQNDFKLVVAGGYDERLTQNQEHQIELMTLAQKQGVESDVIFQINVSDIERTSLLHNTAAVLYTPENEHFGIVPCEAMYMKKPIVACNSGGPKQSIDDGKTGFLLETNPRQWAQKMVFIADNQESSSQMGQKGHERVIQLFGMDSFSDSTEKFCLMVLKQKNKTKQQ